MAFVDNNYTDTICQANVYRLNKRVSFAAITSVDRHRKKPSCTVAKSRLWWMLTG